MYTIKVKYRTGNSFNTDVLEEEIGLVWKDKDLARKCLKGIKEHYKLYEELDSCFGQGVVEKLWEKVREKDWLNEEVKDRYDFTSIGLVAEMDDGSKRVVPTSMWCGYFETLYSGEVTSLQDDEDSFEF